MTSRVGLYHALMSATSGHRLADGENFYGSYTFMELCSCFEYRLAIMEFVYSETNHRDCNPFKSWCLISRHQKWNIIYLLGPQSPWHLSLNYFFLRVVYFFTSKFPEYLLTKPAYLCQKILLAPVINYTYYLSQCNYPNYFCMCLFRPKQGTCFYSHFSCGPCKL